MRKFSTFDFFSETQKGSPSDTFGTLRRKFWQKIVLQIPLLLSITFFDTRKILKPEGLPCVFFRYCETKILKKNRDTPPPFLSKKISDIRSFLKQRRLPLWIFSVLWDTDLDKKSWYTPLFSYPEKNFDTRSSLKHRRVHLQKFWTMWDKILIAEKNDIPLLFVNFFETRFFSEPQKGSPSKNLGTVRQQLWQKIVIPLPFLLSITFFVTRFFLKQKGSPTKTFGNVRQKIINRK